MSLNSIRVPIKSPIFKLFIAILSPYIFLKIISDVGTTQCEHRTVKCNISRLSTCEYGALKKGTRELLFKYSFIILLRPISSIITII